jgi:hypothetical protein
MFESIETILNQNDYAPMKRITFVFPMEPLYDAHETDIIARNSNREALKGMLEGMRQMFHAEVDTVIDTMIANQFNVHGVCKIQC